MRRDHRRYLHDIDQAISAIREFTSGKTFADYQNDLMLRSAVERKITMSCSALIRRSAASQRRSPAWEGTP